MTSVKLNNLNNIWYLATFSLYQEKITFIHA